jgi:beta-aspartyl-peptidase (threonine type)
MRPGVKAIVVHGGAGAESPEDVPARRAGVARATARGWAVLAAGGTALDAVLEAVVELEDDPAFNAGLGSALTADGTVEMDASVMDGETLAAGAVGAVSGVRNPIRLAHAVLLEGREVLLVGPPAAALAARHGLLTCDAEALVTPAARARLAARRGAGETVGAVARDVRGRLAAATSTGGLVGKRPGRVGDSALIGAGTYADDALGAASATGPGEAIIRVSLVRAALELLARGAGPADAGRTALATLERRLGTGAGLILLAPDGGVGIAHTSPAMENAYRTDATPATVVNA